MNERDMKALIFDFGQTLVDSSKGFRQAEKNLQNSIFSELPGADREDFISCYRKIRQKYHADSDFSRSRLARAVLIRYGKNADPDRLRSWEECYWKTVTQQTLIFPEAISVLRTLKRTHRLAMITNSQGQQKAMNHRLDEFPDLKQLFEVIVIAGSDGIPPKPSPIPFARCLSLLNIHPSQSVFIGDDWRIDICGSFGAGIRTIWLQHEDIPRTWPAVISDVPIIKNLKELLGIEEIFHKYGKIR
jgi:putative hydrolase of the HAD superfamily